MKPPSALTAFDIICEVRGLNKVRLRGRARTRNLVDERMFVAIVMAEAGITMAEIGRAMHKHPSTIFNLIMRTQEPRSADAILEIGKRNARKT